MKKKITKKPAPRPPASSDGHGQDHQHGQAHIAQHHLPELLERVKSKGLKITPTRTAILKCFSGAHRLLTIDGLVQETNQESRRNFDWSTVYRCVLKFQEAGIISAVNLDEGFPHYEVREVAGHHHHVICTVCKCVTPIQHCSVAELERSVAAMGFAGLSHNLEFFGVCSHCQPHKI